jgi:excisionase family DNA binding protein
MERYTTVSGEIIEYAATPEVAAFLARVSEATNDPRVGNAELTDLIYGRENPIMVQGVLPNHGMVTREVFENPVYRVLTDHMQRKLVQRGIVAPAPRGQDLTVPEVAKRIGVNESAVRQAIAAGRLTAEKRGGSYFIKPEDLEAFRVTRRGPKPRSVTLRLGSRQGESCRVRVLGGELVQTAKKAGIIDGTVERFERIAIISGRKEGDDYRAFILEPSAEENELRLGEFFVRGHFVVAQKENNARRARDLWDSTR